MALLDELKQLALGQDSLKLDYIVKELKKLHLKVKKDKHFLHISMTNNVLTF